MFDELEHFKARVSELYRIKIMVLGCVLHQGRHSSYTLHPAPYDLSRGRITYRLQRLWSLQEERFWKKPCKLSCIQYI